MLYKIWFVCFVFFLSFSIQSSMGFPHILFDVHTGKVLEHKDVFQRWYPASLTKLMTAYVVFHSLRTGEVQMDTMIRVSAYAAKQEPSKIGAPPGSLVTINDALKMLLVYSSNDIAVALSENIGASKKHFIQKMNREAQRLGMFGTNYENPTGLFAKNHFTTAHDQALLVRALRKEFPEYFYYFSIEGLLYNKEKIDNKNLLIGRYPDADGMKTGFICESGFNLVASATRKGRSLVAIVLGQKSDFKRFSFAVSLLNKGFEYEDNFMISSLPMLSLKPLPKMNQAPNLRSIVCRNKDNEFISPQELKRLEKMVHQEGLKTFQYSQVSSFLLKKQ